MASPSGTYAFEPNFAEALTEGLARVGIRGAKITGEHIEEGSRSANLLLMSWAAKGNQRFSMDKVSLALVAGTATVTLPAGVLDIYSAMLRRSSTDTWMTPMGIYDYETLAVKTTTGRPDRFFVDKTVIGVTARVMTVYPVPENSTDTIQAWVIRRPQDVIDARSDQTNPVAVEWYDAFCAGLTARLAEKFAPGLFDAKNAMANEAYSIATIGQRSKSPVRFGVTTRGNYRR